MSQRMFAQREYTLSQNLKLTLNRFCLSGVLRWAQIWLAHFFGPTRCYYLVVSIPLALDATPTSLFVLMN